MRLSVADLKRCVGCQLCMFACSRRSGEAGLMHTCIEIRSQGGISKGFTVLVCAACPDPPCAKVCPTNALIARNGGGVRLNSSKCIGCGTCRSACIVDAIFWNEEQNKPEICVHCGICAQYCPLNVLAFNK